MDVNEQAIGLYGWIGSSDMIPMYFEPKGFVIDGALLFCLKTEQGLPLDFAVDSIYDKDCRVDWTTFIDEGRRKNHEDWQIWEFISKGLAECINDTLRRDLPAILDKVRFYICKTSNNPALRRLIGE
jgi:hypothetical protein